MLGADGIGATVRLVQPVGPATFVTLSWEGGELTARVPGMAAFAVGSSVHFRVDSEDHLMFFDDGRGRRMAME
jgi:ABC-type sugar transport system ATPase subunit